MNRKEQSLESPSKSTSQEASAEASLSRRRFLGMSLAGGTFALASGRKGVSQVKPDTVHKVRLESSFDEDWLFHRGDVEGGHTQSFNDAHWRKLDLPHDWRIEDLPEATSNDGGATADPSVFFTWKKPDAPRLIGPFNADADTEPDIDTVIPGFGRLVMPGGRSQGYTVGGIGWYRKHFNVPRLAGVQGQRAEIRFDGIYRNSEVWLNGVHLGKRPNGYVSFAYDISDHVNHDGENVIAVRVDNRGKSSRWYSGSGIYRHTWLTTTGPTRIPLYGVFVTTPMVHEDASTVHAEVTLTSPDKKTETRVRMTILDADGRSVASETSSPAFIETGADGIHTADITCPHPTLWSIESPYLYRLLTEVLVGGRVIDAVTTTFGVRSLVFDPKTGFFLNGKSLKLHGGNIHHDHGPLGAAAIDRAEERSIEVLKGSGFNVVRASHNPRSPYLLDVCDRLGMLLYNEFTDVWDVKKTPDDYHVDFPDWWQRDLTSMIMRDRNHPSVIIWSIGNEIPEDPNKYGTRLASHVRSLDKTRPVVLGGMNVGKKKDAWDYVDLGDYHGPPAHSDHDAHPDKAFLQSEDLPTQIYDDWKLANDCPWYIGSLVWSAWDYIGESGSGPAILAKSLPEAVNPMVGLSPAMGKIPYPWFNNFQSDIDLIGQPKPQHYLRSVVNGVSPIELLVERPAPAGLQQFAVWYSFLDEQPSWNWDGPPEQLMTVHAYSNGDRVVLLLNGRQIDSKELKESDKRVATFSVPYQRGSLTAIAMKSGTEIGRKTLMTTGSAAALKITSDVSALTTSRGALAHVLVQVVDAHDQVVPDAVVKISFAVKGAGRLIGVANANPHNVDSFQRPRRWTWHGNSLVILRPSKVSGLLSLTATAEGLKAAVLTLPVLREKSS